MAKRRGAAGPAEAGRPGTESRHGPSPRQLKVGEQLRRTLIEVLQREELHDPALAGVHVTVSEVRAAPDLRHATCFVALSGGEERAALKALKRLAPYLSAQVARRIQLKFACRLVFARDELFDRAERVEALLRRPDVAADLQRDGDDEEDGPDGA